MTDPLLATATFAFALAVGPIAPTSRLACIARIAFAIRSLALWAEDEEAVAVGAAVAGFGAGAADPPESGEETASDDEGGGAAHAALRRQRMRSKMLW